MMKHEKDISSVDRSDYGYVEDRLRSQVVNLSIYDVEVYAEKVQGTEMSRSLGIDLFLYLCSSCHGGNNVLDDTGLYNYKGSLSEYIISADRGHGSWSPTITAKVDVFDIKAIEEYLSPKMNLKR